MMIGNLTVPPLSLIVLRIVPCNCPSFQPNDSGVIRYGQFQCVESSAALSAYARLRLQNPDWSHVLKFSYFTETMKAVSML